MLSPEAIVDAAVGILDAYGLPDLSMRRVATALGVQPGALYHHVADKQTLLALVADAVLADLPRHEPGADGACAWARAVRGALLAHRDAAELVVTVLGFGLVERQLTDEPARLLAGVAAPADAAAVLVSYVLGHVCQEQARQTWTEFVDRHAEHVVEADAGFDRGVRIILAGSGAVSPP